jgi:hypothetical protein
MTWLSCSGSGEQRNWLRSDTRWGGLIAQLLYRRNRSLVTGLALCGTARNFGGSPFERMGAFM